MGTYGKDQVITIRPVTDQPDIDGLDEAIRQFNAFVKPLVRDYGSPSFDPDPKAVHQITVFNASVNDPRTRSVQVVIPWYGYKETNISEEPVETVS